MGKKMEEKLLKIINRLRAQGVETEELEHLALAVESTKLPIHKKAARLLIRNWNRIRGEVKESKDLILLLNRARKEGKESLNDHERIFMKQQIKDFFRIFPATIIAGTNAVLPIPGTSLITPLILKKLNLLPSRWREAHMLNTLQQAHKNLKAQGDKNDLNILSEIEIELKQQAQQRQECDLLIVWDTNKNGTWDCEEIEAYENELSKTLELYHQSKEKRSWFVLHEGLVFGPTTLTHVSAELDALIRYENKTQWIGYQDLLTKCDTQR